MSKSRREDSKGLNIQGNVATVTLVFADEAHREAWLHRQGLLEDDGALAHHLLHQSDSDLAFMVGPEELTEKEEKALAIRIEVLQESMRGDAAEDDDDDDADPDTED